LLTKTQWKKFTKAQQKGWKMKAKSTFEILLTFGCMKTLCSIPKRGNEPQFVSPCFAHTNTSNKLMTMASAPASLLQLHNGGLHWW
jgi:hypothetical protein